MRIIINYLASNANKIIILIFGSGCIYLAYDALLVPKLVGEATFLSLVVMTIMVCFLLVLYKNVTEITLMGNVLKLQGINDEARAMIDSIKQAQTELFKASLSQFLKPPGFLGSVHATYDPRVPPFLEFADSLSELGIHPYIKKELSDVAYTLALGQINNGVEHFFEGVIKVPERGKLHNKEFLRDLTLDETNLVAVANRKGISVNEVKAKLKESLNYYNKLYDLHCGQS